jgi:hypothetical protein
MRQHFRHPQAMFNKGSLFYSHCDNTERHDYYSIWFNFIAAFFRSENKVRDIKLKTHYFISYHVMKCK